MFFGALLLIAGAGLSSLRTGAGAVEGAVYVGLIACGVSLFLFGLIGKADPDKVSHFTLKAFVVSVCVLLLLGLVLLVTEGSLEAAREVKWFKMLTGAMWVSWLFIVALRLARLLLGYGGGVFGVARTVLDEAIRMKIALVFMVALLVALTALPEMSSSDKPVHYRVQTFMSWSLMLVSLMLSLMTIFLSCRTLSAEIENKQIYTLAVKPLGRVHLLVGKWLGIVTLNALLLTVSGGAIYWYTAHYLGRMEPINAFDERALETEVLTARMTLLPECPEPIMDRVIRKIQQTVRDDAEAIVDLGRREAEAKGQFGLTKEQWLEIGRQRAIIEMYPQVQRQWMTVPPHQEESYVFTGLSEAKAIGLAELEAAGREGREPSGVASVQLRYRVNSSGTVHDNFLPVWITANGTRKPEQLMLDRYEVLRIPARLIDDEGKLVVTIRNEHPADPGRTLMTSLVFHHVDGMELLYESGGFGANFFRGVVGVWVKLSFLAMLGLASATFLGFPVACLLALLVLLIANLSPYVVEALQFYISDSDRGAVRVFKLVTSGISKFLADLLKEYAAIDPKTLVVNGRAYSLQMLLEGALWVGVVWTLVVGALGGLIFKKRELARVQV
jgi:ABC-type transport system involved in multi-copper enzyme maturation permease subunit